MNKIILLILKINSTNIIEKSFFIENLVNEAFLIKNNYQNLQNIKMNIKLLYNDYSINCPKLCILTKLIDPIYPLLIILIHMDIFYTDHFKYKTIDNLIIALTSYIIISTSIQCYVLEIFNRNRIGTKDLYFFKIDKRMITPLIFKFVSIAHLGYLFYQNNQKSKLKNIIEHKLNIKK